jgi:hypothetical protein
MINTAKVANLVIPNGLTESNVLDANHEFADALSLTFYNVAATLGTCVIQISHEESASPTLWATLQVGGADLAAPAIGKAIMSEAAATGRKLRLKASAGGTGDQTVYVTKHFEIS